ncbi:MAG: hypothetical protein DI535_03835 [Citrobacter freundii]|nr:MAG: hypothetical protein DI535_03835 [Citrobacter freundii]
MMEYKKQTIEETEGYRLFTEGFDKNIDFLKHLSDLGTFNGRMITLFSESQMHIVDNFLLDSAVRTLQSIKLTCSIGAFSDANSLIRKLRDDLLLYVFLLEMAKNCPALNEDLSMRTTVSNDERAAVGWLTGKVDALPWPIKKKLAFENYMEYLKSDSNIHDTLVKHDLTTYWETLRGRLNDYVHNNGKQFTLHNIIQPFDKNLEVHFKNIEYRTSYIISFFLVLLTMVEGPLLMSTDLVDYLDMNMDPPEDCQYQIAPFVQQFIDEKVVKLHPELKGYLRDNNCYGMKIQ